MMMRVDMVYRYPIWQVGFFVVGLSVLGAISVELIARRFLSIGLRQQHNDVSAAIFSVIGVTFAVLLSFVVMLTFEGVRSANTAVASEAMIVRDVIDAAGGLGEPTRSELLNHASTYVHDVIEREWPAQVRGEFDDSGARSLGQLNKLAASYRSTGPTEMNYHAALISLLARLQDARALRQNGATSSVPAIVWIVMLLGGCLTVASGSFLGAPSLRMHLALASTLAGSGALVVILIIALSNPFRGDFVVSTLPFDRVLNHLAEDLSHP